MFRVSETLTCHSQAAGEPPGVVGRTTCPTSGPPESSRTRPGCIPLEVAHSATGGMSGARQTCFLHGGQSVKHAIRPPATRAVGTKHRSLLLRADLLYFGVAVSPTEIHAGAFARRSFPGIPGLKYFVPKRPGPTLKRSNFVDQAPRPTIPSGKENAISPRPLSQAVSQAHSAEVLLVEPAICPSKSHRNPTDLLSRGPYIPRSPAAAGPALPALEP